MSRIHTVDPQEANAEQAELYSSISAALGSVPNFLKVFANSPAALKAFLGLHSIAGTGSLDVQTRERIALSIAQQNACQYCLSAHTALGRKAGLAAEEIAANRSGGSADAKAAAALDFARLLSEHHGEVSNAELQTLRDAGYGDAEIVEIITHVAMNLLTNMLSKVSQVDIDFPKVDLQEAA